MKIKETVESKESESDIRQRHDELCKLFIEMQTPMELSEETELEPHKEEEHSLKPENITHYKIDNYNKTKKTANVKERNYSSKGNVKFMSNTIKLTNCGKEHNDSNINAPRNHSKEYKGQVRNSIGPRRSSKANHSTSIIINSSINKNKSSMDTKTLMLLAKNYQHKSLPPVFTEAGSTFKATQSSLRNVRDTLVHLTYDYSNSNEVALPMLTLQAIEESHKQFLHKLHPLSEEEKKQRDRRQRQQQEQEQENEKEKYYEEKYKEQHVQLGKEEQGKNNRKNKKSIIGSNNNILSELLAQEQYEEEEESRNNTNGDNNGVINKDNDDDDDEEESIHAILELSSNNETEWNMYVKRARVVAADEFGQTFNPYQNSSLFTSTSKTNNNNNINDKNKKSVLAVPSSLINISTTKAAEQKNLTHGPFSSSVTSSTTNNNNNINNTTNTTTADVINSVVNDPYFDDECASLSDYAAEPTIHEFHNNEFDILANDSVDNDSSSGNTSSSSSSSSEESENEEKEFTEAAKDHVHHSHTKHNHTDNIKTQNTTKKKKLKEEKKMNKTEGKSKGVTLRASSSEQSTNDNNPINDTNTITTTNTKLPFNAPNFLTNDLHLMQIEFAKVIRGVNRMMYIDSYCAEWWNSATQTRRMKLNAIRSNYHARHANTLNNRIRQQLLLHAYYLNQYSARVRLELVNQQRQLRLFDDRFAESEQKTVSLLHEVNTLQRELQEECARRIHLQEEMKLLVKDNEVYYNHEQEEYSEENSKMIKEQEEEEEEKNKKKKKEEKSEIDRANTVNHETKSKDEETVCENVSNKESVDDPLRIELLLLLQNFPFPPELNKDVVAVQKWLQHNPQCCLS